MQEKVIEKSDFRKSMDKLNYTTYKNIKTTTGLSRQLSVETEKQRDRKNMYSTTFNMICRCASFIAEQYVGNTARYEKKNLKTTIDHLSKAVSLERIERGFIENYAEILEDLNKIEDVKEREAEIKKFKERFEDADLWFELEDTMYDIMMRFSGGLLSGKLHQVKDALKFIPRADKL